MSGRTRDETVRTLEVLDQPGASTTFEGQVIYADGGFKLRDAVGEFDPRSGGGGITEAQHRTLDQLVHEIAESSFDEVIRTGSQVDQIITWTDAGKTAKIRDVAFTYTSGRVTKIVTQQYEADGSTVFEHLIEDITYSGIDPTEITRTRGVGAAP